ncbi:hypothetical protein NQ315_005113 [Exocentrus adspersus]|uniref:Lipase domain-containing protein n=1 Tax=Exocentrus adspersus TaxID=1586481 RepID=A0AAV8VVE9_9CUCU|nr:hypothetical protein NQ315_005113 [Exocentrus adspersus]
MGHSLGSHVASSIGKSIFKRTSRKLGRITALDPAGPKFDKFDINTKIFINDADFVDVVHTDIQYYGYTRPAGHVDFYPNSGKHQNGCPQETTTEEEANCSHARSTLYFIESLTRKAKAQEADYVEEVDEVFINVKENAKVIVFGQHVDRDARGSFFLRNQF